MLRDSSPRNQAIVVTVSQLREVEPLRQMAAAQLVHLATCGTRRWFEADTPLVEQEESLGSLFIVLEGKVGVSVDVGATRTVWLYVAGPGSLVDPSALLDPPAAPVGAYALSPVEVLEIPRACLIEELGEQPAIGYEIMRQLCERLSLIARVVAKQAGDEGPRFSLN